MQQDNQQDTDHKHHQAEWFGVTAKLSKASVIIVAAVLSAAVVKVVCCFHDECRDNSYLNKKATPDTAATETGGQCCMHGICMAFAAGFLDCTLPVLLSPGCLC